MPYEFTLPELSKDQEDAVVVAWFKREGANVTAGETVLEVQMAKVSFDVAAPITGRLYKILAPRDAVVNRGTLLAYILVPGEEAPAAPSPQAGAVPHPPAPSPRTGEGEKTESIASPGPSVTSSPPPDGGEVLASPIAKRLAREHGIDLALVKGTGARGRITEEDVQALIAGSSQSSAAPAAAEGETARVIPLVGMRGAIARRMADSLHTMAQLTLFSEADVTELAALRERLKAQGDITYTDLIVRATVLALQEHPHMNAWLQDNEIRVQSAIYMGVAVAVEAGLVVPVVRDAGSKSLRDLAQETRRLAEAARAGKLSQDEMSGGTFSVTNLGMYGIDGFTPIINPPEVAILGVGRIVERATRQGDSIAWRQFMTLSLTFDHRAVDGAPAAMFLRSIGKQLEAPSALAE
ncbi:MAG: dihydrolipoamide acetyltransferase family protein [Anaerolineae bacterium]